MRYLSYVLYIAKTAYYVWRIVARFISCYAVWLLTCLVIIDHLFGLSVIPYAWIKNLFTSLDIQVQSALISSAFTIVGIFVSVYYASRQWHNDINSKNKTEMAFKITGKMYDACVRISEIIEFVVLARNIAIHSEYYDEDTKGHAFSLWKEKRAIASDAENDLTAIAHDISRICNVYRAQTVACGFHSITVTITTRINRIANKSKSITMTASNGRFPDQDEILTAINMYCIDVLVAFCESSITLLQIYSGMITKKMTDEVREYTVEQLLLMIRLLPFAPDFSSALKTGVLSNEAKITKRILNDKELLEALNLNRVH